MEREGEREKESGVAQWVRHDLGLALTHFCIYAGLGLYWVGLKHKLIG
jgi:hypothetical protein